MIARHPACTSPCLLLLLGLTLSFAPAAAASSQGGPPASVAAAPRDDTLAYLEGLPETNPYRATLLRFHTLPAADREALKQWAEGKSDDGTPAPSLTPSQQTLAHEFAADLISLSTRPPTEAGDWPLLRNPDDPDNPAGMMIPGAGLVRQLAKLATRTGDTLPPEEATAVYAAVAQLGRQQRGGSAIIEQLVGVAVEGVAFSAAGRRLSEFSPEELRRLSAAWSALQPGPDNARAFAGERDLFFTPILNKFIRPGLVAMLAGNRGAAGEDPAGLETDPDAGFTDHLRLSGLADIGDGERRISLENTATGVAFTIAEGKSTDGIELVSLDFEKREAIIRRGSREAVIHLESKRIVERHDGREDIARLRKFFGETAGLLAKENEDLLNGLVERARKHPGGADGYVDDLLAAYRRILDAQLAAADLPDAAGNSQETTSDIEDPFLKAFFPQLGRVARTLNNSATSATVLQAAIHQRLAQLGAATPDAAPVDPWTEDGSPFAYEATPDGGFLLRSRYEVNPGKPLTYKFSAPDAGFVRPK